MQKWLLLMLMLVIALTPIISVAQDNTIAYGDEVFGQITDAEFEIPYTFAGSAGDVIVAQLGQNDILGDFNAPSIVLLNSDNSVLANNDSLFASSATIAAVLQTDGDYTLLATRRDGRTGEATGEFVLRLFKLENLLEVGDMSDTITSDNLDEDFYYVQTRDVFTINYARMGGEFTPEIEIKTLNNDGILESIAALRGGIESGSLTIDPFRHSEDIFFVTLGTGDFDFYFDTVTVDYTISAE